MAEVDPAADPRWDSFLATRPEALVYHHSAWLRCLAAEYDEPQVPLACEDTKGRLVGVLPLVRTRGVPFRSRTELLGRRLSSLPRTPLAGPVATGNEATAALLGAAVERVRADGVRLQIKRAGPDLQGVGAIVGIPWRRTYVRALPSDPGELRFGPSRNHARVKWAVNKARKAGLNARSAQEESELRAWYRLYLETMRSVPIPPRPYRFFLALWELMRPLGLMRLLLAERRGAGLPRLLAGSVFLTFGREVSYAFTGASLAHLHLRPHDLIQWESLRMACEEGLASYDFGEVADGHAGLAAFKSKWGTEERRLYRYYFPPPAHASQEQHDGTTYERAGALAKALWRRVPLRLTAAAGDRLYRYL